MTFGVTNEVKPKSNRAPRKPRVSAASLDAGSVITVAGRSTSGRAVPTSPGTAANAAVEAGPNGSAFLAPNWSASPNGSAAPVPNVPAGLTVWPAPYESTLAPNPSVVLVPNDSARVPNAPNESVLVSSGSAGVAP